MPGSGEPLPVPVWGYSLDSSTCRVPGPVLEATAGDTLRLIFHNHLAEPASVIFPGQAMTPQPVKDSGGHLVSFDRQARAGGYVIYSLRLSRPGTFRYESGTNPGVQVQMGLAGAILVRPRDFNPSDPATWTAYGSGTRSQYDQEQLLILGEIDSALHAAVGAGLPYDLLEYRPDWWTINGRAFPDTVAADGPSPTQPMGSRVVADPGDRVLLRCINVGFSPHALHLGGLSGRVVAEDAIPLKTASLDGTYEKETLLLAPGQVCDVIVTSPGAGEFYVFDRDLRHAVNEGEFPGGMMTRLEFAL
ncbi:MAG: multicopper oxidase domain-containing protein [Bacillota bacterium]